MCSKTTKILFLWLLLLSPLTINAQWLNLLGNLIGNGIESKGTTEAMKIIREAGNISLTTDVRDSYARNAKKLGLSTYTVAGAIDLHKKSSNKIIIAPFNHNLKTPVIQLGNGYLRNLQQNFLSTKTESLKLSGLNDVLSSQVLAVLLTSQYSDEFRDNLFSKIGGDMALAAGVNSNPRCLDALNKSFDIYNLFGMPFLGYISNQANSHANLFKKSKIADPLGWSYNVSDNLMTVSSPRGRVFTYNKNGHCEIGEDKSLLNCYLPSASVVKDEAKEYTTDRLGRIVRVTAPMMKSKFKDSKIKLKSKDILAAKSKRGQEALFLIPKDLGGAELWTNVYGIQKSKGNKQNLKVLNKAIKAALKSGKGNIKAELNYYGGQMEPSFISYYINDELICILE